MMLPFPGGRQDVFHSTEMAAVRDMSAIMAMQTQYLSQFQRYASSLAELGPSSANLIPANLAAGQKGGYFFRIVRTAGGYTILASPALFGKSGHLTFYADESMVIHQNWGPEPASAGSPLFN